MLLHRKQTNPSIFFFIIYFLWNFFLELTISFLQGLPLISTAPLKILWLLVWSPFCHCPRPGSLTWIFSSWETVTDVTSITMLHASLCPWQVRRVLPLVLISSTSWQLPSTVVTKCLINWVCLPVPTVCNGFYTKIASFFKNCNRFWGSAVLVHVTKARSIWHSLLHVSTS